MQSAGQVLCQDLTERHTSTKTHGVPRNATTAGCRAFSKFGDGLCGLVLHELAHVAANHAHANLLIHDLLQFFRQRQVLHRHAFELQADPGKLRGQLGGQGLRKSQLVGGQVQKRNAAAGDGIADVLQHQSAQLAVQITHLIALACAGDFGMKQLGVGDAKTVVSESAQAHGTKVLVADGDGLRCTPFLVHLLACAEEIDIALERRLEQLVPVLQVGQYRQGLGGQLVRARAEDVGHLALVYKHCHL